MASTINTNSVSLNAQRNLSASQMSLSTSMQRLSSGLRVNSAKDDAAGLAISERMNAQSRGMSVAIRNANPRRPPKVPHLWPPKLLHPAGGDLMH